MFFSSWDSILRIFVVGLLAYVGLILLLRISGNRTLSKMNSFDLVVTVALGSTLASGLLQKSVPLSDTLFAFAVLIGSQYMVTYWSVRSEKMDSLVKSEPVLLFRNGEYLRSAMKKSRVTEDEIRSAIRLNGFSSEADVQGVILETNGRLSAFGKIAPVDPSNSIEVGSV